MKACIILPSSKIFTASQSREWGVRWIHHGVALLIAYAKKQGIPLDLIDVRRLKNWSEYEQKVSKYNVLCFSINSIDYPTYLECLSHAKNANPSVTVVVGGIHPTVKISDFINDIRVNYIIQKEGEVALTHLLNQICLNIHDIPRVQVGEPVDLDSIPYIDRDLWLSEYPYGLNFCGEQPFITILISRACLHNCFFCQPCARTMFGNVERRRNVENVIGELRFLDKKYHFKSWMVHDDGFLQNLKWVKEFVGKFKAEFGPRPFIIQSRADYPVNHTEIIPLLRSIGLEIAIVGFESGSDMVLKFLRKGTTRQINLEAAKIFRMNGIKIFANIMFGVPTETKEDIDLTMSMVREMKPEHFSAATFSPYPGSYLHDYCMERGLVLNEYASRYIGEHKIMGIDYEYIQSQVDLYNRSKNRLKFWLQHSNLPLANSLRGLYRKVRSKVT